jgi:copper(I)-binding protein
VIFSNRSAVALRALVVVMAAGLALAIAGCEAGSAAPTQHWHPPTAGASTIVDNVIRINNVFVLGAPPAASLPAGGSAGLFLALANSGAPDRLLAVTAPGTALAVQLPAGGVGIAKNESVLLTGPAPRVVLRGLLHQIRGGQDVRVVLHFLRAGAVSMVVPVMPRAQFYSTFSPAPVPPRPTPSATLSGKAGTHRHASPSPSATPSASPTA